MGPSAAVRRRESVVHLFEGRPAGAQYAHMRRRGVGQKLMVQPDIRQELLERRRGGSSCLPLGEYNDVRQEACELAHDAMATPPPPFWTFHTANFKSNGNPSPRPETLAINRRKPVHRLVGMRM